jgi:hypothetical protein
LRYDIDASSLLSMWVPLSLCCHYDGRHLGSYSPAEY